MNRARFVCAAWCLLSWSCGPEKPSYPHAFVSVQNLWADEGASRRYEIRPDRTLREVRDSSNGSTRTTTVCKASLPAEQADTWLVRLEAESTSTTAIPVHSLEEHEGNPHHRYSVGYVDASKNTTYADASAWRDELESWIEALDAVESQCEKLEPR